MDKKSTTEELCPTYQLNLEDLIDPRIREQKIYNDCLNILLEENLNPENNNINFRIMDLCISLDKELEKATLLFREENGTPYINDKNKEVKRKPIEYKRLNVSLSDSNKLVSIYIGKYNDKQIQDRKIELQSFSKNPNIDLFNTYMNELKELYAMNDKEIMYITHWLTNVKRQILNMSIELPQILCFTSTEQFIGKSILASTIAEVINKRLITTDLIKLSARFQPLTLTTEAVLWIDELKRIDKNISDNIKQLITTETIDFEYKGKNGFKQYKKLASIIMSINYDPSKIFFEDETQRRIAIIHSNKYTQKKTREELKTLLMNIWDNSPIEYSINPDTIAELTFQEKKENSILENFATEYIFKLLTENEYLPVSRIMNGLFLYNGGRQKLITFLRNKEYFMESYKANKMLVFKATDTFKELLKELIQDTNETNNYLYEVG
ncbi:hypothetical protein AGMMS49944_17430 [Spirochaetia bacterium]|nr:hypothetical protein AGMMS49944_17430 [Spirochaetia bacterium]